MTRNEKIEWVGIGAAAAAAALLSRKLPNRMDAAHVLIILSFIFLLQALLRDLSIMLLQKPDRDGRELRCMCLESIAGFIPVAAAGVLTAFGCRWSIELSALGWSIGTASVMILGFVIKDYVIIFKPFRVIRDKNHMNIIFKWNP